MMEKYFFEKEKVLPPKILTGHDVMKALDLDPSPLVGQLLKDVSEAQAEGKVKNKAEGLAFLKIHVSNYKKNVNPAKK